MEDKELKIIEAAMRLFLRHGYRKVTMSDIAEASEISRPSLYAVFSNKEAVFSALVKVQIEENYVETKKHLESRKNLKERLDCIFEIWILKPFASVIDSENAKDLLSNCSTYSPDAIANMYARFEEQIIEVLEPEIRKKRDLSTQDLAHILMLATKGLKASTETLPELRRMIDGLISMTLATIGNADSFTPSDPLITTTGDFSDTLMQ